MGCTSFREGEALDEVSLDCSLLMKVNLEYLSVIQYLFIERNKQSTALAVMLLKIQTEEFYTIISKYRKF